MIDRNRTFLFNRLGAGQGGSTNKGGNDHLKTTPEEGGSGGSDRPEKK